MLLFALTASRFFPMRLCNGGPANQGRRCWVANDAASCPWHSSCKSPRTLQKCKLLITRQLTFGAVLGGLDLCSPSTRLKVNHLCIRYLWFKSVRGDFLEGHFYAFRCHLSLCLSTKTPILCSGREEIGIGKHNHRDAYRKRGLPANHRAHHQNINT